MAIEINNYADLQSMSADLTASYILMSDIDASGEADWVPVGDNTTHFTGTFDGNGKTITGLHFNNAVTRAGLFGVLGDGGHVYKVALVDVDFVSTGQLVGGIAGETRSLGGSDTPLIDQCYVHGSVEGLHAVGAIVGALRQYDNTTQNCYTSAHVISNGYGAGGIAGLASWSDFATPRHYPQVKNCYARGTQTGAVAGSWNSWGGLVANHGRPQGQNMAFVSNSFSVGPTYNPASYSSGGAGGLCGRSEQHNCCGIENWTNNAWCSADPGDATYALAETSEFTEYTLSNCTPLYDKTHSVYASSSNVAGDTPAWDFDTIWEEQSNDFPILKFQVPSPVLRDKTTYDFE